MHTLSRTLFKVYSKVVVMLCHLKTIIVWRSQGDPTDILWDYATPSQRQADQRLQQGVHNTTSQLPSSQKIRVGVIIPFRDRWPMTCQCVESLLMQDRQNLTVEVCLVDNGSCDPETHRGMDKMSQRASDNGIQIRILRDDRAFNFSQLNNLAAQSWQGDQPDWFFLLNNDAEFRSDQDLRNFVAVACSLPDVGAVGCTLVYPNQSIQHLFLAPGSKVVGSHPFRHFNINQRAQWYQRPRPVAAVTGAALLLRCEDFFAVGALDENLPSTAQDLDLCLKLQKAGKINWVLPAILMTHHESVSLGHRLDPKQIEYMYRKWGHFLTDNPYYSSDFSKWSERPRLSIGEGAYPWWRLVPW